MIGAASPGHELQSGRAIRLSELASAPSITNFLRPLKKSPRGAVFNPWWHVDADNDIGRQAPRIRRQQLRAYLSERIDKARLALIGEALSYRGGHFTGIAMTSERILLGGKTDGGIEPRHVFAGLLPRRTSKPQRNPSWRPACLCSTHSWTSFRASASSPWAGSRNRSSEACLPRSSARGILRAAARRSSASRSE
jgi:hypothetical protein